MSNTQFKFRLAHLGLVMASIGFTMATPLVGLAPAAHAQALRPEIGNPLKAAADMAKKGNARGALAKVREANAVGGKSAHEQFTIDRMMASVAMSAGDTGTAINAMESLVESGKLGGEKLRYIQSIGSMYYSSKNYGKAIQWLQRAQKEGDNSETTRNLITSARFASGDAAGAAKETAAQIAAIERAGRVASEDQYSLMANVASRSADKSQYVAALEKLVAHYPKRDYWADLLNRVTSKKGFNSRLNVDVYRLRHNMGLLKTTEDYMELAQLTMRDGQGAEAKKIVTAGYAAGVLGAGANAERHNRLRAMADKMAAETVANAAKAEADALKANDAYALSNIGFNLVHAGQAAKGLALMEQALKMGHPQYLEHIRLHLGMAYAIAGKKPQAIAQWKAVKATDGAADLARYWTMQTNRPLS